MRVYCCIPSLIVLIAACGPRTPGPAVQALLDSNAPELRIGERITPEAHRRYDLQVLPYTGYRDSGFTNANGLSDLVIRVDEYIDDGNPKVSPRARIEDVRFRVLDSRKIADLVARADAALGAPEVLCFRSRDTGRLMSRYWPGSSTRGLGLLVRFGPAIGADTIPGMSTLPVGTAVVRFGAERPVLIGEAVPVGCPSQPDST